MEFLVVFYVQVRSPHPHLIPPGRSLYGLDPNARLEAAIADINAHHHDAAVVLVTGDLVHDGEPASCAALRRALENFKRPIACLWETTTTEPHSAPRFQIIRWTRRASCKACVR